MVQWMGMEVPGWVMVAFALALIFLATQKSSRPSSSEGRRNGKAAQATQEVASVSAEAVNVAKRLGVTVGKRRVPVTILINNVVFRNDVGGRWSPMDDTLRVVALLNEVASVFLIACVATDDEEERVRALALSSGLVKSLGESSRTTIPEHKLLFCSGDVGQIALVRQLRVSLHIGGSVALMEGLSRFVPVLVRIGPDAMAPFSDEPATYVGDTGGSMKGNDCLGWKEYTTLAAAAGFPCPGKGGLGVETPHDEAPENVSSKLTFSNVGRVTAGDRGRGTDSSVFTSDVSGLPSPSTVQSPGDSSRH